jgi:hypothetical protein
MSIRLFCGAFTDMKFGTKGKALLLLTLFIGVLATSFACQLLQEKKDPLDRGISILKSLDEDDQHWAVRVNEAEKENLSLRILENFDATLAVFFHGTLSNLHVIAFSVTTKLYKAENKLFLDFRKILI